MKSNTTPRQQLKTVGIYALAFLLPTVMIIFILQSIGISYNGKLTLLTSDMRFQYMPFITELRYLFQDWRTLLFNWNNSLGGNYMGIFAYYMASPLNVITLLWDIHDIPNAIYILYILKIGLSGFTFNIYLHQSHPNMVIRFSNIVFSTCYACMSYMIIDGISIMWLDAIILLPLVLLGTDKLCEGKSGGLFLTTMMLVFFSNFYMSYIIGIFTFLYFCAKIFISFQKDNWKICVFYAMRFAANTLLSFGLTLPIILPTLLNSKYSQLGRTTKNVALAPAKVKFLELLKQFLPGQYVSLSLYNLYARPFIFCGSIFLILVPLFFLQKRPKREKIVFLFLSASVFLGFIFQPIDYVWHGFRYPAGFPYRYAFLFSFLIIVMGYKAWLCLSPKLSNVIVIILALYTVLELYANDSLILAGINRDYGYQKREEYEMYDFLYTPLMQTVAQDTGFNRRKSETLYFDNWDSIYGTKGTLFFSSAYYNQIRIFFNLMGSAKDITGVRVTMNGCTPLLDSLMGIKYLVRSGDPMNLYIERNDCMGLKLYENPDALSLGFSIPQNSAFQTLDFNEDVFRNQILFMDYLGISTSQIYRKSEYEYTVTRADDNTCTISAKLYPTSQNICLYLDADTSVYGTEFISFYLDGELFRVTNQTNTRSIYFLPPLSEKEEHQIQILGKFSHIDNLHLYEFDTEAYKSEIAQIRERQMEVLSCEGNHIKGFIDAAEPGLLFVTLPYDEGYTVYVDGESVPIQAALDTFLSFPVEQGAHNIEIVYFPPGLKAGLIAMAVSILLITICYLYLPLKKKCKKQEAAV